ncbi:MAG: hypothetical protein OEM02_03100 [Desulfobulbaceae bacterium]|nr:hypothetical protein [Desulfobulbaceae bacterium]
MKLNGAPVRSTIIYAAMGAVCLFTLSFAYPITPYSKFYHFYGWVMTAGYGYLLVKWSGNKLGQLFLPLLTSFLATLVTPWGGLLLVLPIHLLALSWIRSSICFPNHLLRGVILEIVLCFGAATAATTLTSHTPGGTALAVWIFFLIQALYFPLSSSRNKEEKVFSPDIFEKAGRQVERILAS